MKISVEENEAANSKSFASSGNAHQFSAWAERNDHWIEQSKAKIRRAKHEPRREPLILCGHGVSLNVDRGALFIRDGLTHYPQERATYRFFKGDLALPPRIIMLDGSGSLSFDVIAWLAEQRIPLVRIDWRGEIVSVIAGSGYALIAERVAWQIETRAAPQRRLEFARDLISAKLRTSLKTLNEVVPAKSSRDIAISRCEGGLSQLAQARLRDIEEVRAIEANAAAAYFNAWKGLSLTWRSQWKHPVPDAWLTIGSRRSSGRGRFASNRNASHPLNAMLNYAYGVMRSQVQIELASAGYDPCRGIMHHDRPDTQALVYDLIEPCRPVVDASILKFTLNTPFTGADFVLTRAGACRLAPQLARRVSQLACGAAMIARGSWDHLVA